MSYKETKHTKKAQTIDELSTPEARAERLRRIRNMANLSRQKMCNTDDLNVNTYKGWEIARFGGLPTDGAKKVLKRVFAEGVRCTLDWLLYGKGPGPYIIPINSQYETQLDNNIPTDELVTSKDIIYKEIMVFKSHYKNAIFVELQDDCMHPIYNRGDIVAGVKLHGSDIKKIIGENCIVKTSSGDLLVRTLMKPEDENYFNLTCLNSKSTYNNAITKNVELEFAASIVRHYKLVNIKD